VRGIPVWESKHFHAFTFFRTAINEKSLTCPRFSYRTLINGKLILVCVVNIRTKTNNRKKKISTFPKFDKRETHKKKHRKENVQTRRYRRCRGSWTELLSQLFTARHKPHRYLIFFSCCLASHSSQSKCHLKNT
jgi:hypothetical protein